MTDEPTTPGPTTPGPTTPGDLTPSVADRDRERRPIIERIGLAAIALVLAALFGTVAAASIAGGEPFLGVMGVVGCLMTLWVGASTLIRG
jgi:hypothetical protein